MLFENLSYLWENYQKIVFGFVIFYVIEVLIIIFHQEWMIELIFYTTPLILGVAITTLIIKNPLDPRLNRTIVFITFLTINEGFLTSYMVFELVEHIIGHENHHDQHDQHDKDDKNDKHDKKDKHEPKASAIGDSRIEPHVGSKQPAH
jgi:thiol:disulfide interchange protein